MIYERPFLNMPKVCITFLKWHSLMLCSLPLLYRGLWTAFHILMYKTFDGIYLAHAIYESVIYFLWYILQVLILVILLLHRDMLSNNCLQMCLLFPQFGYIHKHLWHSIDGDVHILVYEGFYREQWVGVDIIILLYHGVLVANGIPKIFVPYECFDANPLWRMNM